jgi:hypothetical protein
MNPVFRGVINNVRSKNYGNFRRFAVEDFK